MSTIRLEPARVGTLTAKEGEGRWYGFDLQLAIFALSLIVIGLLMAFTNSADDPFRPGSIFTRGLIWLALAAFVPKQARKTAADPAGVAAVKRDDSDLVVLAYLDDTRTKGNAATEVVKYFLQLHYGLRVDLRNHSFLVRDNFYDRNN